MEFSDYSNQILYEQMTIEDYNLVMESLGGSCRSGRYKTICHNYDLSDAKYNLAFIKDTRTFYCHSECQETFSLLSLVKRRFDVLGESKSYTSCLKYICDVCGIEFNSEYRTDKIITSYSWQRELARFKKSTEQKKELKIYDDSILNSFQKLYHNSWLEYGITKSTMDKYEIMWYSYRGQIVIPVRNDDRNLIGIRVRNVCNDSYGKYIPLSLLDDTMYAFPTNEVFYGSLFNKDEIKEKKMAVLVESEKTILKADSWFKHNLCLGMFGSNLGIERVKYLVSLGVTTIIIALDSDFIDTSGEEFEAFKKKVNKMIKLLNPFFDRIYVVYNNLGFKDCYKFSITDYTMEQYEKLWKSKIKVK